MHSVLRLSQLKWEAERDLINGCLPKPKPSHSELTNWSSENKKMGWGNVFFTVVIGFSAALITYNIIISANASLKQEFPGKSLSSSSFSVDPIIKMPTNSKKRKRLFHTAVTASDSIYNTWQTRVMYYWFKQQKKRNPDSEMGGFTRILHSGKRDRFMDEIPTFVAQPLPDGMDQVFFLLQGSPFVASLSFWFYLFVDFNNHSGMDHITCFWVFLPP